MLNRQTKGLPTQRLLLSYYWCWQVVKLVIFTICNLPKLQQLHASHFPSSCNQRLVHNMHLPSRFTASSRLLLIDEPKPDSSLHTLWLILTCSATFMRLAVHQTEFTVSKLNNILYITQEQLLPSHNTDPVSRNMDKRYMTVCKLLPCTACLTKPIV